MLPDSIFSAIKYVDANGIEIPRDVRIRARRVGAIKAGDDLPSINANYHDAITQILTGYFEDGGSITAPRNEFKRSAVDYLGAAFDLGWTDGGQDMPPDVDALNWFNARIEEELGHIETLFVQAKELRGDSEFYYFSWITARADGYTRTIKEFYNAAKMRAMKDIPVTFLGDDGAESCADCQKLKGKRHRLSWFVKRNYIPPFGTGLECHPGGRCQHGLFDDNGNQVTA